MYVPLYSDTAPKVDAEPQVQAACAGRPQPEAQLVAEHTAEQTALEAGVHAEMYVVQVPHDWQAVDATADAYMPAAQLVQAAPVARAVILL